MKKNMRVVILMAIVAVMSATVYAAPADAAAYKDITAGQAKTIALKDAKTKSKNIKKYRVKYDDEDRSYEIRFVVKKNSKKYNYEIDKATGIILERDVDFKYRKTASRKKIGKKAAIKKVIKVSKSKASVVKAGTCTYRYKDREGIYQVKFRKGNRLYEYELLAPNGKIKEIEYKYVGKK